MNPGFWKGKRVLVTGHTGFKGGWLTLWLQSLGAQVTGFALDPPTDPSLFVLADVARGMASSHLGDVRDLERIKDAVAQARPEIIFHMAAQALVRLSYDQPEATYATNVMGTVHLLEAVRAVPGVRAVVNITTDKCYENREWVWGYREDEPMGGFDPYSNSKGCMELVTAAYRNSFFNPGSYGQHGVALATVRAGNVIGGGDWAKDRLIPDMMRAFLKGEQVVIRNPAAIRPWQHVLEPLGGYLLLAERLFEQGPRFAESWNFGPNEDDTRPVVWIVEHLAGLWGEGAGWRLDPGRHPHEATFLRLDCLKAKTRLGWRPRWDLPAALGRIVEWYRACAAGQDLRAVTLDQIAQFSATPIPQ
jgi:CDP-glucose 4,6-dehydratase